MASSAVGNLSIVIGANATPFDRTVAKVAADVNTLPARIKPPAPIPIGDMIEFSTPRAMRQQVAAMREAAAGGGGQSSGLGAAAVGGAALGVAFAGAAVAANALAGAVGKVADLTIAAGRHAVTLAAGYEMTQAAFETMTGSAGAARAMLADIDRLAIRTPFGSKDLAETAGLLMANAVAADAILPALERLGDVAAGDAVKLKGLATVYGQVVANGKMNGGDLLQFGTARIGRVDFAKTMGVDVAEFTRLIEAGQVGADVMVRTINRLTDAGGRYFGGNAKASETVQGQWNALVETVDVAARNVGLTLFRAFDVAPTIGRVADAATGLAGRVNELAPYFDAAKDAASAGWDVVVTVWDAGAKAIASNRGAIDAWLPTLGEAKEWVHTLSQNVGQFAAFTLEGFSALEPAIKWGFVKPLQAAIGLTAKQIELTAKLLALPLYKVAPETAAFFDRIGDGAARAAAETNRLGNSLSQGMDVAAGVAKDAAKNIREAMDAAAGDFGGPSGPKPVKPSGQAPAAIPVAPTVPADVQEYAKKLKETMGVKSPAGAWANEQRLAADAFARGLVTLDQWRAGMRRGWQEFAADSVKALGTPLAKYQETLRLMQAGVKGGAIGRDEAAAKVRESFDAYATQRRQAAANVGPLDKFRTEAALLAEQSRTGQIDRRQYASAFGAAWGDLEKVFEKAEVRLPAAMQRGTQEYESALSKAISGGQNRDPMKRVEEVLKRAETIQRNTEINTRATMKALEKLRVVEVDF